MISSRRSAAIAVLSVLSLAFACKSDEKKSYERAARDANPVLATIRPVALTLMAVTEDDPGPGATAKIIETCTSVDQALSRLRDVRFDIRNASIARYAGYLLDERTLYCRPELGDGSRTRTCRRSCLELWKLLVDEVANLRAAAAEEGVDIVSLSP
jgi:hypothetical protein